MEKDTQRVEDFELGEPVLVCRWRIAGGRLPLENRHLRAFSRRTVAGRGVTTQLLSWAKQHIEWTLADGSADCPDGVLMIAMDEQGRAAMSVGPYVELPARDVAALAARAEESRQEAAEAGVAPETFWAVRGGGLVCAAADDAVASGAASLVADLAKTLGIEVSHEAGLLDEVLAGTALEQAFLCSDEHGIVVASDAEGDVAQRFADAYAKLLASERAK